MAGKTVFQSNRRVSSFAQCVSLRLLALLLTGVALHTSTSEVLAQSGTRSSATVQPSQPSFQPSQPSFRSSQPLPARPFESNNRFRDAPPNQFGAQRVQRPGFDQVDHRNWDTLLQKYVDRNGNVDYPAWLSDGRDRAAIRDYLNRLTEVDTSARATRNGEMAFWINTYNALTIEGIMRVFPTTSIKNHAPDKNGFNIWDDFKVSVDGRSYSLNDIEHKVLRPLGDARIHFAIVCASKGCPQLSQRAYFAKSLDQQLTNNARLFFRTPEKFNYDLQRRQLNLSPIVKWFAEDFGRNEGERLRYLAQFMPDQDSARLALSGAATVNYLDYDWSLNLATTSAQRQLERRSTASHMECQESNRGQFQSIGG